MYVLLIAVLSLWGHGVQAPSQMDYRMVPVSDPQLRKLISETPLKPERQMPLLSRAYNAGLAGLAYELYTLVWKKNQGNSTANLLRGLAAENYEMYATHPAIHEFGLGSPKGLDLDKTAEACLAKAVELDPDSAAANTEYGFFLWQFLGEQEKGMNLLKKAATSAPGYVTVHNRLGYIYTHPIKNVFQPQKAEHELREALHIEPTNAYSHCILTVLFILTKQYQKAKLEVQSYRSLVPDNSVAARVANDFRDQIDQALHNK